MSRTHVLTHRTFVVCCLCNHGIVHVLLQALGALAEACRAYNGGVVVISHHQEFISAVCTDVSLCHVTLSRIASLPMLHLAAK